jgi:Icc protein
MSTYDDEGGDPACWAHLFEDERGDEGAPRPEPRPPGAVVLQLSDVHLTRAADGDVGGVDPVRRLRAVLDRWRRTVWAADLVLLTGDNTDDGAPEAYRRLHEALLPIGAPILAIAGNHDDLDEQEKVFGPAVPVEVGAWRIVGLTSAVAGQIHGAIDADAVARQLDGLDDRPTIVAIHHPPVSRSTHEWFRLEGGAELLAVLAERPHVRALVSGHLHDAFELAGPGDLALLGAPSSLVAIGHHGDTFEIGVDAPAGARVLHLADDGTYATTLLQA